MEAMHLLSPALIMVAVRATLVFSLLQRRRPGTDRSVSADGVACSASERYHVACVVRDRVHKVQIMVRKTGTDRSTSATGANNA